MASTVIMSKMSKSMGSVTPKINAKNEQSLADTLFGGVQPQHLAEQLFNAPVAVPA